MMSDNQGVPLGVRGLPVISAGWQDRAPDQVYQMTCRALGLAGLGLPVPGTRMVEAADGSLYLQVPDRGDALEPADWAQLVQHVRQRVEDPGAGRDEPDGMPLEDPAGLELLERIEAVWLERPDLVPHVELDDEQPALVLAPDQADWTFVVIPAPWAESVRVLLPLLLLPDDPAAQAACARQALRANDQRLLGEACSMLVEIETDMLMLHAVVQPAQMDTAAWEELFGRMLASRDALLDEWRGADAPGSVSVGVPSDASALPLTALRG